MQYESLTRPSLYPILSSPGLAPDRPGLLLVDRYNNFLIASFEDYPSL